MKKLQNFNSETMMSPNELKTFFSSLWTSQIPGAFRYCIEDSPTQFIGDQADLCAVKKLSLGNDYQLLISIPARLVYYPGDKYGRGYGIAFMIAEFSETEFPGLRKFLTEFRKI